MDSLGPRQKQLLSAWGTTIRTSAQGNGYDFTAPTRTARVQSAVEAFIATSTEDAFAELWSSECLRNVSMSPVSAFLSNWHGPVEELATFVEELTTATEYDPAWERQVPDYCVPTLWELYGRSSPSDRPLVNFWVRRGLATYGFGAHESFSDITAALDAFDSVYTEEVGHGTGETAHEVPVSEEIEQFFYVTDTLSEAALRETLDMSAPEYQGFSGWDALQDHGDVITLQGLEPVLDAFTLGADDDAYDKEATLDEWGANHWETWKDEYHAYLQADVFPSYDPTALRAEDVAPFIEALSVAEPLSDVIPVYLLGGRWQPWDSFTTQSVADPEAAAEVLSTLLDSERAPLSTRLTQFSDFYSDISDSGSERMSVATMLLMLIHPGEYVMYRYQMFKDFFDTYSEYTVPTGFNPSDYALMNEALGRVRDDLDSHAEQDVRMLDVHSLLWLVHREGPP